MNMRISSNGNPSLDGNQIEIGGATCIRARMWRVQKYVKLY